MSDLYVAISIILVSLPILFAYLFINLKNNYIRYLLLALIILTLWVSLSFVYSSIVNPIVITKTVNLTTNQSVTTQALPGGFENIIFSIETILMWIGFIIALFGCWLILTNAYKALVGSRR